MTRSQTAPNLSTYQDAIAKAYAKDQGSATGTNDAPSTSQASTLNRAAPHPQPSIAPTLSPEFRCVIAGAGVAAWKGASRLAQSVGEAIESGAGTLGQAATRALPAVAEAAPVAGGIVSAAYAAAKPLPAGNPGEDAPNAEWRAHSLAASDRATTMIAHPNGTSTTPNTAVPSAFIAHLPESSTTVTPTRMPATSHIGSSTPANVGVQRPTHTGHTAGTPATDPTHTTPIDPRTRTTLTTPVYEPSASDQMLEARKLLMVGPDLQGTENGSLESGRTVGRAGELKSNMGKADKFGTTMAVAVAKDANGNQHVLVSSNEYRQDGTIYPRVQIKQGEIAVTGSRNPDGSQRHAEENMTNYAKAHNLSLVDISVTRPMCGSCQDAVRSQSPNVHISTPLIDEPSGKPQ